MRPLLAICLVACATAAPPSWRDPPTVAPADDDPPPATAAAAAADPPAGGKVFAPAGEPAARYNDPPPPSPRDTLGDEIARVVGQLAPQLARDGRLDAVAADMAALEGDGPQPYDAIQLSTWYHGLIQPGPQLYTKEMRVGDLGGVTRELRERLPEILAGAPSNRYGLAVAPPHDGIQAVVIALLDVAVETDPIPRELARGAKARVRARVRAPYTQPEIFLTAPSGVVSEIPVVRSGPEVRGDVPCVTPGKIQVEVAAHDGGGSPVVLANFAIWCGQPAQRSLALAARDPVTADAAAIEQQLLQYANKDRIAAGLLPFAWHEKAAEVCRAHATEMREKNYVAHVSPITGAAADRAKRAGIATPLLLENLARDYSPRETHEGLMNSPGHRANLMNPHATHVGIGVSVGHTIGGEPELYVCELFLRVIPKLAPEEGAREVIALITAARAKAGAAPVAEDPALSKVAMKYAADLAAGQDRNKADDAADRALSPFVDRYAQVLTVVTVAGEPADAVREAALDARSRFVGVGVVQGRHPDVGDNAMYIVTLLATPRR